MIWRALVLFGVITTGLIVGRTYGDDAGKAVYSGLFAIALILSEIERRLAEIVKGMKG